MEDPDPLLARVKQQAGGMLPLAVYRRIFDSAAALGGGTIVEIGTAQGAATIVLALGAVRGGKPFRIFTADPFATGSRRQVGTVEENLALVRHGFEAFGVADRIEIVVGTSAELAQRIGPGPIDLLMIDADGRIDRDLAALHARLAPGCPIIIDDVDGQVYLHRDGRGVGIDQKHRIARLLAERFAAEGLLIPDGQVGQTGWYRKGPASPPAAAIERIALDAYRELVRARIGGGQLARAARGSLARRAPWLARAWRRLRRAPPAQA